MPQPQSLSNHTRYDPPFHFVLVPILILNLIFSIYATVHHWPWHHPLFLWWIVMSLALLVLAGVARSSAVRAQDRLIRLEERLRLTALLPSTDHALIHTLTERQLIALRFASDAELHTLAVRAARENLTPKQIKESITSWRPDHFRV